ncbi:phytanoyl-CoA dioxygenase family protein [Kineobactrum salinum]|uniref:Phytanoyl-CoA dioxygenase n=1 Tax=Kineobactrum salinum TaxID=2708301 RepID=A0A6C0U269_9GAMM|nr:phytanoyl-CoA dioxygenase family protein [Kineobactrum salinum]QIB66171.1 phytanoyl-CoA dioxygenase [Kineobactrum salinum]
MVQHDPYASRTGGAEAIHPRLDPVVYGGPQPGQAHALNQDQLASFERDGYLILPDLCADMLDPIRRELASLKQRMAGDEDLYTEPDSDEPRTLFRVHAWSSLLDRLMRDPRLLQPVEQILGSSATLMQSRINIKPAFRGKSFPWHSDFETWHVEDGMERMRAVTAWIMLTDNHACNGPLYVIPGSHKHYVSCAGKTGRENYRTSLKRQNLGVPRHETMRSLLQDRPIRAIEGGAGTLVLHDCNLLHGSPDNISADPRSILMFVYNSAENPIVAPFGGLPPRPDYLCDREAAPLQPLPQPLQPQELAA